MTLAAMSMPDTPFDRNLIRRLPAVRGRLSENAPLGATTWFRVGGPAEVLFRPADAGDLAAFLSTTPDDIPVTVIGVASNLIIRDGGIPGVVIKLGGGFADIKAEGDTLTAGAAALDVNVAQAAAEAGIAGLEFLSGIPGSIGGALRMNGGAYGTETSDVLVFAEFLDRAGKLIRMTPQDMHMSYRHNGLPDGVIFVRAVFKGHPGEPEAIRARMKDIRDKRAATQPIREKTSGSTFANPPGMKAWELIDRAGCRGLRIGGAEMSPMHCNFMINTGDATAADLETLGETVIARVLAATGVKLEWEIRRIGMPLTPPGKNRPGEISNV